MGIISLVNQKDCVVRPLSPPSPLHLTEHDLDIVKARRIFNSAGLRLDKSKLESLGILVPFAGKLVPSIGGIILFGNKKTRSRICPDARVICARFRGIDKSEFLDRLDIGSHLIENQPLQPGYCYTVSQDEEGMALLRLEVSVTSISPFFKGGLNFPPL